MPKNLSTFDSFRNNIRESTLEPCYPRMFVASSALGARQKLDFFMVASLLRRLPLCVEAVPRSSLARVERKNDYNLPRLPVQPLDQMFQKYLNSIKPFVNSVEYKNTEKLVNKFLKDENLGVKLQMLLEKRAEKSENWLSDWWLDTAYLEYRDPLVVFSSPGLVWPKKYFFDQKSQLVFAANIIVNALKFNELIEKKELPQEYMRNEVLLCMSQYERIFGTCRIPKFPKDELKFQDPSNPSTNILVIYNNHLFSLPAFCEGSRTPFSKSAFFKALLKIVEEGDKERGLGIGVLTSEHRDNWAKVYEELKRDPKNKEILEKHIEKALFAVCIDKPLTLGSGHSYDTRCSKLLLHGFGFRGHAGNRWYDKTIQFVIGSHDDGVGITYEHSPAEGGPIGVLSDYILARIHENFAGNSETSVTPTPEKLEFNSSDVIMESIEKAGKAIDAINNDLDVCSWSFKAFGKTNLKSIGVSPDSFIQIAIQYAFFKIHNRPGAQYESGSLRKFMYGRTDTIRTCLEEVVNFCRVMTNVSASNPERANALRAALQAHKFYCNNVIEGCGVDRHLLGLRLLAKSENMEELEIFKDPAYKKSTHFQLSTSNVPVFTNGFMVYGPLVKDGYACCYNMRDNTIIFGMTAWADCGTTYLENFRRSLQSAIVEMHNLLSPNPLQSKM